MRSMKSEYSHQYSESLIITHLFRHPNVISYKESFFEDATSTLCIIMEYADDGDLLKKIETMTKSNKKFDEAEVWSLFIQMILGL
jgi:NIMA (never in mitosis gene a)-related kinase